MTITKQEYEKTKKFIEEKLDENFEKRYKIFCSIFGIDKYSEIDQVKAEINTNDVVTISWTLVVQGSTTKERDKEIYNSAVEFIKLNSAKEKLEEQSKDLEQYEVISEKVKDLHDKNKERF